MRFRDELHEQNYKCFLSKIEASRSYQRSDENYYQAAAYLLALDAAIVEHIEDLFDFAMTLPEYETALCHEWHTENSRKTTRLLMNLNHGFADDYERVDSCFCRGLNAYSVFEIFGCENAPYYWEAVKLRFPEYCNG